MPSAWPMAAKKHKATPKPKGGEKSPPFLLRLRCQPRRPVSSAGWGRRSCLLRPADGSKAHQGKCRTRPGQKEGQQQGGNFRERRPARQTPRGNHGPQCTPPPGGPPRNCEPRRKAAWGRPAGKIRPARPLRRVRGGEGLNLTVFWPECPITFEIWFEKNGF